MATPIDPTATFTLVASTSGGTSIELDWEYGTEGGQPILYSDIQKMIIFYSSTDITLENGSYSFNQTNFDWISIDVPLSNRITTAYSVPNLDYGRNYVFYAVIILKSGSAKGFTANKNIFSPLTQFIAPMRYLDTLNIVPHNGIDEADPTNYSIKVEIQNDNPETTNYVANTIYNFYFLLYSSKPTFESSSMNKTEKTNYTVTQTDLTNGYIIFKLTGLITDYSYEVSVFSETTNTSGTIQTSQVSNTINIISTAKPAVPRFDSWEYDTANSNVIINTSVSSKGPSIVTTLSLFLYIISINGTPVTQQTKIGPIIIDTTGSTGIITKTINTNSYFENFLAGNKYTIALTASNSVTEGIPDETDQSSYLTFYVVSEPTAPILTLNSVSNANTIVVGWTDVPYNLANKFSKYVITCNPTSGGLSGITEITALGSGTSTIELPAPYKTYTVKIVAYYANPNSGLNTSPNAYKVGSKYSANLIYSADSNIINATGFTAASFPGGPFEISYTVADANAQAKLTWWYPTGFTNVGGNAYSNGLPVTGYRITNDKNSNIVDVGASTLSTTITGLTNGTRYKFFVQAITQTTAALCSFPTPQTLYGATAFAFITPFSTPSAPSISPTATILNHQVNLTITDNNVPATTGVSSTNATYTIEITNTSDARVTFTQTIYSGKTNANPIINIPIGLPSYNIINLTNNTDYKFKVLAVYKNPNSVSNDLNITTANSAPQTFTPLYNAGLYNVSNVTLAQNTFTEPSTISIAWTNPSNTSLVANNMTFVSYTIAAYDQTVPANTALELLTTGNQTAVTHTYDTITNNKNLIPGHVYKIGVYINATDLATFSSAPLTTSVVYSSEFTYIRYPDAPTAIYFTNIDGATSVDLTWTAPTDKGGKATIDKYYVVIRDVTTGVYSPPSFNKSSPYYTTTASISIQKGTNDNQYTFQNNHEYEFKIYSVINNPNSTTSEIVSTTGSNSPTMRCFSKTLIQENQTITPTIGDTSIGLSWYNVTNEGGLDIRYIVRVLDGETFLSTSTVNSVNNSGTSVVEIPQLENGTLYTFQLRAELDDPNVSAIYLNGFPDGITTYELDYVDIDAMPSSATYNPATNLIISNYVTTLPAGAATLSWTAPVPSEGNVINNYSVHILLANGTTVVSGPHTVSNAQYLVSGLGFGNGYKFSVIVNYLDSLDTPHSSSSTISSIFYTYYQLEPPTNLTFYNSGNFQISFEWDAPENGLTGYGYEELQYNVYLNNNLLAENVPNLHLYDQLFSNDSNDIAITTTAYDRNSNAWVQSSTEAVVTVIALPDLGTEAYTPIITKFSIVEDDEFTINLQFTSPVSNNKGTPVLSDSNAVYYVHVIATDPQNEITQIQSSSNHNLQTVTNNNNRIAIPNLTKGLYYYVSVNAIYENPNFGNQGFVVLGETDILRTQGSQIKMVTAIQDSPSITTWSIEPTANGHALLSFNINNCNLHGGNFQYFGVNLYAGTTPTENKINVLLGTTGSGIRVANTDDTIEDIFENNGYSFTLNDSADIIIRGLSNNTIYCVEVFVVTTRGYLTDIHYLRNSDLISDSLYTTYIYTPPPIPIVNNISTWFSSANGTISFNVSLYNRPIIGYRLSIVTSTGYVHTSSSINDIYPTDANSATTTVSNITLNGSPNIYAINFSIQTSAGWSAPYLEYD